MLRKLALFSAVALVFAAGAPVAAEGTEQNVAKGEVVAVDAEKNTLKVVVDGKQSMTFDIAPNTEIVRDGKSVELSAVQAGDAATINYEKSAESHLAISVVLEGTAVS